MAIKVVHTKVSTIPDGDDSSLIRPSDWNSDHTLIGLGTMAEQNANNVNITGGTLTGVTIPAADVTGLGTMATQNANNVSITGGSISGATVSGYIPTTEKGVANGVATLDGGGTVPISQLPAAVLGALNYQGTWDASTNTPTLTSSVGTKGYYYVVNVAGSTNLNGITDWKIGDWAVYNGTAWQKIDNTDAVTSVNGYTGTVVLTQPDIAGTVPTTRTISTGTGLTGGGDLSANRTISFSNSAVATWAATPTSANLAAAVSDETGSGSLVFGTAPTLSAPVIDGANPYIQFNNGSAVTVAAGKLWYDGSTGSWNAGMGGGNITQQIGEEIFIYGKASAAITEGQLVSKTGTVGASGVITFAPSAAGLTDNDGIIGVATENIPLNGFGRITFFGVVHGINTTGVSVGETWANNDTLWYNPSGNGTLTNVKPTAPNIKFAVATVINAGSGGSGSIQVLLEAGSTLGGTDSNVQITSVANGNLLTYDGGNGYWKNTDLTAGTGISVSKSANGVLTITNTSPSSGGTVTSVSGTAPIASSGGNTPTISISQATTSTNGYLSSTDWNTFNNKQPAGTYVNSVSATSPITSTGGTTPTIAMPAATGSVNGYLTSTDWTTFNNKSNTNGTVTNVSALTLGTTGTDLSSTVANSTTTPVITLNVPTASATNRGALSAADWSTFNGKAPSVTYTTNYVPFGQGTTTPNLSSSFTYVTGTGTLTAPVVNASNGIIVNSKTVSASYTIPSGSSASSTGPMTVASGQTVTVSSGSRWVVL